jgi:hypothetical protein
LGNPTWHWPALRRLALSYCRIQDIPSDISNLAGLEELHLDRNHISRMPHELTALTRLTFLSLVDQRVAGGMRVVESLDAFLELTRLEKAILVQYSKRLIQWDFLSVFHIGAFLEAWRTRHPSRHPCPFWFAIDQPQHAPWIGLTDLFRWAVDARKFPPAPLLTSGLTKPAHCL